MRLALCLLPLAGAAAAAEAPQAPVQQPTIVVTATPLAETERRLRQCLERHCPPDEDIAASLAHAENLFIAGDYRDARATTKAAIQRNRAFARSYPLPLSGLFRADSRISAHLGDRDGFYSSGYGIRMALKSNFPPDHPLRLAADIEVGDMLAALGSSERARYEYEGAARTAERAGRTAQATIARVRMAWLDQDSGNSAEGLRALHRLSEDRRPEAAIARLTALAILARLDRLDHKNASSEALIDEIRKARLPKPLLVFSPPIDVSRYSRLSGRSDEPYWADIGFQVAADGLVSDVDVLRSHGRTDWVAAVVKSIENRIYAPADPSTAQGSYRVERYSYSSMLEKTPGAEGQATRRTVHGPPRIYMLDLTADPELGDAPASNAGLSARPS